MAEYKVSLRDGRVYRVRANSTDEARRYVLQTAGNTSKIVRTQKEHQELQSNVRENVNRTEWVVTDGWETAAEANDHAARLRKAHPRVQFRVRRSDKPFGGGHFLVEHK